MIVDVSTPTLTEAVAKVAAVANHRSEMPVLSHIELAVDGDQLVISATDLFVQIRCTIPVHGAHETGNAIVHAKTLKRITGSLTDPDVTLATTGEAMTIRSGRRKLKIHTLDAGDFPANKRPGPDSVTLPGELVAQALGSIEHALATDQTREHLCQAGVTIKDGVLVTMATDGHRAAKFVRECDATDFSARIMVGAIKPILALCKGDDVEIDFGRQGSWVFASSNGVEIGYQEHQSDLAPIDSILKGLTQDGSTVVHVGELRRIVSGALSLGSDHCGGKLDIRESGEILIRIEDPKVGEAEDFCEAVATGNHLVGLNLAYLSDALKQFSGDVSIKITGELDPVMLFDEQLTAVIMPVRI